MLFIDDFLKEDVALQLAGEFPNFNDECWYEWNNPLEFKRACNNWNRFPSLTYRFFSYLCSDSFTEELRHLVGHSLISDPGLNGGGWHTHKQGGKLNTHLDYSVHPKLGFERKLNIIIYISPEWLPTWGGALGLWTHNEETGGCGVLDKVVDCIFNRAVIFDTSQNSWHGLPSPLSCPAGRARNSLAVYYGVDARESVSRRGKALFVPAEGQEDNSEVLDLIKKRSDVNSASSTYNSNK